MKKKDIKFYIVLFAVAGATLLRLFFAYEQMMTLTPGSAPIDDDLYYQWAVSIANGNWLGEYNYLTLSKYPFFAVYLAFIHNIGMPYLVANCILWIALGALCVWAFSPLLKNAYLKTALYLVMIYNPSTWASYNLRVYRDSVFPILCTAFFVAAAGMVLRIKGRTRDYMPFALISGIAIGTAWITREDGYWLLPFGTAASVIAIICIATDKNIGEKPVRIASLFIPYVITAICVLTICNINNKYYGAFTLTDFSSGAFAECYGNMTRLSHENWNPIVAVPKDVRERMYRECPSLAILKDELEEGGAVYKSFANKEIGDYKSGAFYWALRRRAQFAGIYENHETAENYWKTLSREVARMCEKDENALSPRKSVTPPIKSEYVMPVIRKAGECIGFVFTQKEMICYDNGLSDSTADNLFEYAEFYNDDCNYRAIENSYLPYHTPTQKICYAIMEGITWIYRALIIPLFALSLLRWCKSALKFTHHSYEKQIAIIVLFGLVMMGLFRIFIISYMEVSAFGIGIYAMYLGAVYPLVWLTSFIGNTLWLKD